MKERPRVYVRTDVLQRYGDPEYCEYYNCENYWVDNPRAYGEQYDAYER